MSSVLESAPANLFFFFFFHKIFLQLIGTEHLIESNVIFTHSVTHNGIKIRDFSFLKTMSGEMSDSNRWQLDVGMSSDMTKMRKV